MTDVVQDEVVQDEVVQDKTAAMARPGEWAITGFMIVFFAGAYLLAQDFPFRAALFPQMVSVLGLVLSVLRILGLVRELSRARRNPDPPSAVASTPADAVETAPKNVTAAPPVGVTAPAVSTTGSRTSEAIGATSQLEIVDDDVEDDASMEYVFASAGGRAWLEAMAWIVVFFVAFFVVGAFLSVPLFALFYLRLSGGTSWLSAVSYAVVSGVLIYLVFRELVYIPLPTGVLPFRQI